MPWDKTPADRERDARNYGPEYRRNREVVMRRAGGRCEQCHHRHSRLQCDHIKNIGDGPPDHSPGAMQALCVGPGSCKCHEKKTAGEGGGYRAKAKADPAVETRTRW